jgi:hypothetical protein
MLHSITKKRVGISVESLSVDDESRGFLVSYLNKRKDYSGDDIGQASIDFRSRRFCSSKEELKTTIINMIDNLHVCIGK